MRKWTAMESASTLAVMTPRAVPDGDPRTDLRSFLALREGDPVTIVAADFCRALGWGERTPEFRTVIDVARIADRTMRGNPYHGPHHAIHVAANAMWLSGIACAFPFAPVLTARDRLLLLIAALAHDAGHDGGNNGPVPFRLERIAADLLREVVERHAAFSEREAARITSLVMATEPMVRRRVALAAEFAEAGLGPEAYELLLLPDEVAGLADPGTAALAALLSDADLFSSVGLGLAENARQTELVFREQGNAVDHDRVAFFLNHIATTGFASPAGALFLPAMAEIRRERLCDLSGVAFRVTDGGRGTPLPLRLAGMRRPVLEAPLHPEIVARFTDAVERLAAPDDRVEGVTCPATGGVVVHARDARLEMTRSGAIIHYVVHADVWRAAEDPARGIPALTVPHVRPRFEEGPDVFLTDPHGACFFEDGRRPAPEPEGGPRP